MIQGRTPAPDAARRLCRLIASPSLPAALEGSAVLGAAAAARDGNFVNPDGNAVEAQPGTVFADLELSPSPRSRIRVEIGLPAPERWDGRLVGLGNGGAAGRLPVTTTAQFLRRGCAVTTTDLGTAPDPARAGCGNPEVWKDFGHRATHLAMLAGKALCAALYGRPPRFTYFVGGSTGGQQGMSLAQRHPEDCDAVIAAVPAHARVALHAYFLWNWQTLHRRDGSLLFTDSQERSWRGAVLETVAPLEAMPRARGRFVSDPRVWNKALLEDALRLAARRDPSLGPDHIAALRRLDGGPVHAVTGQRIFGGLPPGAEFSPACGNLWIFDWAFGPGTDPFSIDFGADFDRYRSAMAEDLDAESADLDAFRARGGRLLVYSGTADSCVPWHSTAAWHARLVGRHGGNVGAVREFCRYYLLPGRSHTGGPGVQTIRDEFNILVRWREKGVEPKPTGHGMTPPAFDLPLEPFE